MSSLNIKELLHGTVRMLDSTYRYSTIPTNKKENVSAHTFYTTIYGLSIAESLLGIYPNLKIDFRRLSMSLVYHDIDEGINGDVLRQVKRYSQTLHDAWNEMCVSSVKEVSNKIGIDILDYWVNDKDKNTIEGNIVAISDFLSVYSYTWEEYMTGNKYIIPVIMNSCRYIFKGFSHITPDNPLYLILQDVYRELDTMIKHIVSKDKIFIDQEYLYFIDSIPAHINKTTIFHAELERKGVIRDLGRIYVPYEILDTIYHLKSEKSYKDVVSKSVGDQGVSYVTIKNVGWEYVKHLCDPLNVDDEIDLVISINPYYVYVKSGEKNIKVLNANAGLAHLFQSFVEKFI